MMTTRALLLATAASYCSAFTTILPATSLSSHHVAQCNSAPTTTLHATPDDNNNNNSSYDVKSSFFEDNATKLAGSAIMALTLSFSPIISTPFDTTTESVFIPTANAYSTETTTTTTTTPFSSILMSKKSSNVVLESSDDDLVIKSLEKETREVEAEVKRDAKKARVEKSREAFFEYEAKMAEEQEARIEAAEKKAEAEVEADKKLIAELDAKEKEAEKEAKLASSKKERAAKEKEAKVSYIFGFFIDMQPEQKSPDISCYNTPNKLFLTHLFNNRHF